MSDGHAHAPDAPRQSGGRVGTEQASAEKSLLLSCLNEQRSHVLGALNGLDDEALHRAVLPSGWSALGLVRHLAIDVEWFWFRGVVAGEQAVVNAVAVRPDDAWQVGTDVPANTVLDRYREEIELANAIIAVTELDATPAWIPDFFGDYRPSTVRQVILHVLTETACHAGHLDAARELIDGAQWLVLTD